MVLFLFFFISKKKKERGSSDLFEICGLVLFRPSRRSLYVIVGNPEFTAEQCEFGTLKFWERFTECGYEFL